MGGATVASSTAADGLRLGWDHRDDLALFKPRIELGIGISSVGGDRFDGSAGQRLHRIHAAEKWLALIRLTGGHLDVKHDADLIVDGAVLLAARLKTAVASIGCHAGIGVGRTDLLGVAALSHLLLIQIRITVRCSRRIDVDNFALGNACLNADPHRPLEDPPEPVGSPPLADTRKRGMVWQPAAQHGPANSAGPDASLQRRRDRGLEIASPPRPRAVADSRPK